MGFNTQNGLFRPSSSFFLRPSSHDTFSSCSHFASSIVLQRYNTFHSYSTLQPFSSSSCFMPFAIWVFSFCHTHLLVLLFPAFFFFLFVCVWLYRGHYWVYGVYCLCCVISLVIFVICFMLFANFKLVGMLFVMLLLPCVLFLVSVVHIFLFLFFLG